MENILINVDSRFRNIKKYKNPGNFTYFLKEPLKNITSIRLATIELPTTFYTFLYAYNNITFSIISNGQKYDIQIEEGNYLHSNMITQIQSKFDYLNTNLGTKFSIVWDDINYKVTISENSPFTLLFYNDDDHRSLGNRLGYRGKDTDYLAENQSQLYNFTTNTIYYAWTSDTFLDITKDEYCYMRINDYGVIYNDIRPKSLLAKIILYDQQFVIDNGANFLTKEYIFKQPTTITKFEIELINILGNTIDMNLIDFSFTLELKQIYDSTKYDNYNFVPGSKYSI